jgi:hypothetical protein
MSKSCKNKWGNYLVNNCEVIKYDTHDTQLNSEFKPDTYYDPRPMTDAEAKKRGYILHIPVSTLNPNNKESIKHPFCKTNTVHKDT